ncbi:MAG: hypothetical protein E7207_00425 [Clostridium butyricum]|nr:hypothetical protein [Clostridium butyricum]
MKKLLSVIILFVITLPLFSCDVQNAKYINFTSKPSSHYYTDKLRNKILNNDTYDLYVFDTNLYKEIPVENSENIIIENFLNSLTENNYLDEPIKDKEPYRIKIVFKDDKYLIRVYNESLVSISPWDGTYKEDTVSMDNIPLHYNLTDFCRHIENEPLEKK